MTRFEFLGKIDAYKKNQISVREMGDAVETYSAALLQQTPCSTLRAHLDKMLNLENAAALITPDEAEQEEHLRYVEAIQRVILLIEDVYPVA